MPWTYRLDETAGYDCMTAGFVITDDAGELVCVIDLRDYGQANCSPIPYTLPGFARAQRYAELIVRAGTEAASHAETT